MNGEYKCPACGKVEGIKIKKGEKNSDMYNFQYAPHSGFFLKCPECGTRTRLYSWGEKVPNGWLNDQLSLFTEEM